MKKKEAFNPDCKVKKRISPAEAPTSWWHMTTRICGASLGTYSLDKG
jgi:hypothetical protein